MAAAGLRPAQALTMLGRIAAALDYAHAQRIVHRDIKPANILVDADGATFVADFGVAHLLDASRMTTTFVGTPAYCAPEQVRGESPTGAADQYALAACCSSV